jgi:hypothetical protein
LSLSNPQDRGVAQQEVTGTANRDHDIRLSFTDTDGSAVIEVIIYDTASRENASCASIIRA